MARDTYIWGAVALTGGASGAIDAIAYADLQDKDPCITAVQGDKVYHHVFDSSSSAAESSPDVIAPDDVGANTGRWLLVGIYGSVATDPIFTAAGGLVVGTGDGTAKELSKGAANLKLFMNSGGTTPEWAGGVKIITSTRDMTAASGNVAYSGVGFLPSNVLMIAGNAGVGKEVAIGMFDATSQGSLYNYAFSAPGTWRTLTATLGAFLETADKHQGIVYKSMDSDGFTLTWTKTGTPSAGTITLLFLCFR